MALDAPRAAHAHLPEEALENYAFGRLSQADLANFEEHLLVCANCQDRLKLEDDFASMMLTLAASETAVASMAPFFVPNRRASEFPLGPMRQFLASSHVAAWAAGLAGVLAVALGMAAWWSLPLRITSLTTESVTLESLRGGSTEDMAQARSHRPLDLSLDLGEISSSALGAGPYRLEVVDAAGNTAWASAAISSNSASSVSGKIEARVESRLDAGVYWVRLYSASGKLLREFGLHLH